MKLATSVAVLVLALAALVTRASADNLRLDVSCADYWATPDTGLDVLVDGAELRGGEVNSALAVGYTKHGNEYLTLVPTDVGFTLAPGTHHISVGAPGCAPLDAQVSIGWMPAFVSGRLPIHDDSLTGPTGAPDGFGLLLGAYTQSRGPYTTTNGLDTTYAWNELDTTGAMVSLSYEHRRVAFAYDLVVGTGTTSGMSTTTEPPELGGVQAPRPFTANELGVGSRVRVGLRLPERSVAFAVGSGIGGDVTITTSGLLGTGGDDFDFFVPLWASLTVKPSCSWGVQVLASYDVHPTAMAESAPELTAGLQWQPSAACSESPGLTVR